MSYGSRSDYLYNDKNGVIAKSIQPVEDSERTRLQQQPVRLQPSWEESNLPEDELNFKSLTMEDASLQLNTPIDKYRLVYLTFLIHGIGVLTPWNMFTTATSYFTDYKLSEAYVAAGTHTQYYAENFLPYLCFASQIPNFIFSWLNIFIQIGGKLTSRIVWSITLETVIFIFTIILAMIDTSGWPGHFFWITMATAVVLNMANGIYQNTIFGVAAKLPGKYTGVVVLGTNISGTFTAVVRILSDTFTSSTRTSAIYYFITALFVLLVCFDTYFALPLNKFYRHYELKEKKETQTQKQLKSGKKEAIPYFQVFKQALMQLYNIFFVFFVSLAIYPTVHSGIKAVDKDFILPEKYFSSVTCFLTFNLFAALGNCLANYVNWPSPKYLWIPVTLRVFYIPFFLLCNYEIPDRALPVMVTNDWVYWITAVTLGFTGGYFSSLGMMYAPRTVEPKYATTAGMFGAAMLVTGIFVGILVTFLWPPLIRHVGY